MQSPWIDLSNNPYPHNSIIGIVLVIICGVVGGLLWIYFRDIAGDDKQPARRPDDFTPPSLQNTRHPRHGGCVIFLFSVLFGITGIALFGSGRQLMKFFLRVKDTDNSYYHPDRNPPKETVKSADDPGDWVYSIRSASNADWTDANWTADDAPYIKIRREVDKEIADGTITRYEFAEMHDQKYWREHPEADPRSTFRNAYIGYALSYRKWYHYHPSKKYSSMREQWPDYENRGDTIEPVVYQALLQIKTAANPHSFQYSRLVFLLESFELGDLGSGGFGSANPDVIGTEGGNLLAHRPKDWEVKLMLVKSLDRPNYADHKKQALNLAQEVVAAKPRWPQAWETLGTTFQLLASENGITKTEQKRNNAAALVAYRKCLKIAPKDYGPRLMVELSIKRLVATQKKLTG